MLLTKTVLATSQKIQPAVWFSVSSSFASYLLLSYWAKSCAFLHVFGVHRYSSIADRSIMWLYKHSINIIDKYFSFSIFILSRINTLVKFLENQLLWKIWGLNIYIDQKKSYLEYSLYASWNSIACSLCFRILFTIVSSEFSSFLKNYITLTIIYLRDFNFAGR